MRELCATREQEANGERHAGQCLGRPPDRARDRVAPDPGAVRPRLACAGARASCDQFYVDRDKVRPRSAARFEIEVDPGYANEVWPKEIAETPDGDDLDI